MSKIDDILRNARPEADPTYFNDSKAKRDIKDLILELIGENESVSQAEHGTDWEYRIHGANALREVLRRKVNDL